MLSHNIHCKYSWCCAYIDPYTNFLISLYNIKHKNCLFMFFDHPIIVHSQLYEPIIKHSVHNVIMNRVLDYGWCAVRRGPSTPENSDWTCNLHPRQMWEDNPTRITVAWVPNCSNTTCKAG